MIWWLLGISHKIREMFSSVDRCQQQLNVWQALKGEILGTSRRHDDHPRPNIWDGERIKGLKYFFDPNQKYQLPAWCDNCGEVLSVDTISDAELKLPVALVVKTHICFHNLLLGILVTFYSRFITMDGYQLVLVRNRYEVQVQLRSSVHALMKRSPQKQVI